jgi:LuxR family transcriptional regulator, maltose regulon positive regulatory protein
MPESTAIAPRPASFTHFGKLLRYLRCRAHLSQHDLGVAVGYSVAEIAQLEGGQRLPDAAVIAAAFVPSLDLDVDSAWAARLLELAEMTHVRGVDEIVESTGDAAPDSPSLAPHMARSNMAPETAVLLITKLYAPRPRPDLVVRPRLQSYLNAALHVPLTLVSAPAGFGKTTLLASWLHQQVRGEKGVGLEAQPASLAAHSQPVALWVAWLALDEGDNDPTTFLRYLIAAFQMLAPTIGASALALLRVPQPPSPEALLRLVLNDLATLPKTSLLVVDDYHLIRTPAIHAAMTVLLQHLPPPLHVVIATREDPPLPIARLRARGQLLELRAAELRFTPPEAETFLKQMVGQALTAADVEALETRTEGWIAGLQLAALAMQNRTDLRGFISAFTGSNHFVLDYLAAEVVERQPSHLQAFLLQTSILDRLCGPLCDAVMGIGDVHTSAHAAYTQALLEELERANLFVVSLDDTRTWYRYHHLFGEVLRERLLRGATAQEVASLHRRASVWHEGQGLVAEAIYHALAAQDWDRAARMIEIHGLVLILSGQVQTVLSWLYTLPAPIMQNRPLLIVHWASGLMFTNQFEAAEVRLEQAERCLQSDTPDDLARLVRGRAALCRGIIGSLVGDLAPTLRFLQQALALLPAGAPNEAIAVMSARARAAAGVYLAEVSYQLTGDVTTKSEQRAADAILPVRTAGYTTEILHGYTSLATLHMLKGRLRAAAATYAQVERLVPGQDALQALIGSPAYYVGMGDLLREWNDLNAAESYLALAMDLLQGTLAAEADVILRGYVALARVQQARGNGAAALATLQAFVQVARERKLVPLLLDQASAMQARLHLMQNDLRAASRWAESIGLSLNDEIGFSCEAAYLTLARLRIAQGRGEEILPLLDRLLADAETKARMHSVIEIRTVQALAYHTRGDQQRALTLVEEALVHAEPEGYVRVFLDGGAPMAALLHELIIRGDKLAPYCKGLLAAFDPTALPEQSATAMPAALPHPLTATPQPLVERLSERELDVLRLIAAGHSNHEIAHDLIIAVGTVKRHVHSIFGKLGVSNRLEAVIRAGELGILDL